MLRGVDKAKDELKEIVAFLKDPDRYGRPGVRMPKGVLLVCRREARVPFFSNSGSDFVEMFVGLGAAQVR